MPLQFAERLAQARQHKGLSQTDLAVRTGLQPSAISHFETGRRAPSAANLRKLADALSTTVDFLLGRDSESTAAGPTVAQLLSSFARMSASDQDNLTRFAAMLAAKNVSAK